VSTRNGTSIVLVPETVTIGSVVVASRLAQLGISITNTLALPRLETHSKTVLESWKQHWETKSNLARYPWFQAKKPLVKSLGVSWDAQPYAIIPNRMATGICGQLISSGYVVPDNAGVSFPMQICVNRELSVPWDPTFTVVDFANTTGDADQPHVPAAPMNVTVTQIGVQYCAMVSKADTYYAIARVVDFVNGTVTFDPAPTSPSWWAKFYHSWYFWPVLSVLSAMVLTLTAYVAWKRRLGALATKQSEVVDAEPYALRALYASTLSRA
jgi:hypothetical protein